MKPKIKRVGRFWVCGGPYEIAGETNGFKALSG
ncbi:MAG: hypothetical protein RIQ76_912 [Pseudomonadota bacterium]